MAKANQLNLMQIESYYDLTFQERNQVLLKLSKPKPFFMAYYNSLPHAKTNFECFNTLNDLHFDIFGYYMYTTYKSFQNQYSKHINSKKQK